MEKLLGEGEVKTIVKTRIRRECEECGEPAHFKYTFLYEGTRRNPFSSAYGKDDCSWCEDVCKFVCKEHEFNNDAPFGMERCSQFTASDRFAHLFLYWDEKNV